MGGARDHHAGGGDPGRSGAMKASHSESGGGGRKSRRGIAPVLLRVVAAVAWAVYWIFYDSTGSFSNQPARLFFSKGTILQIVSELFYQVIINKICHFLIIFVKFRVGFIKI